MSHGRWRAFLRRAACLRFVGGEASSWGLVPIRKRFASYDCLSPVPLFSGRLALAVMKARWLLLAFAVLAFGALARGAGTYVLNERIEVNILGSWDKATVIEVGSGEHAGEYKVHYEGYNSSYDRWLNPVYFRKTTGAPSVPAVPAPSSAPPPVSPAPVAPAAAGQNAGGPRLGKYNINSWGATGKAPLFLGQIELLPGGKYHFSRSRQGGYIAEGDYRFDAGTSAVEWLSGPCKEQAWSGAFTAEREGKTHKIRLRSTTIATNT